MSVSTNGQICFGVAFEEGFEFPWDTAEDGDIELWWREEKGFKQSKEIFNSDGGYTNPTETTEAEVTQYFKEQEDFLEANPLPVELVNYCSDEYPMYVLAVPITLICNKRGDAVVFEPENLGSSLAHYEIMAFFEFCEKYKIELPHKPLWLLTCFWG